VRKVWKRVIRVILLHGADIVMPRALVQDHEMGARRPAAISL